jgi:hypothetical protein
MGIVSFSPRRVGRVRTKATLNRSDVGESKVSPALGDSESFCVCGVVSVR